MNVNFEFTDAGAADKIYFDDVTMEKRGGGLVSNPSEDLAPSTPLVYDTDGVKFTTTSTPANAIALLGSWVYAGKGDQPAKIVLGGVVRKANAVDTTYAATLNGSIKYV